MGLDVQTDVLGTIYNPENKKTQICHFDIIIFENKIAKNVIEIKRSNNPGKSKKLNKQKNLYSRFGIPLLYCYGYDDIENIINYLENI